MIASVVAQSHSDWELVFVDDGSSDGTASIISKAAEGAERIKVAGVGDKVGKVAAFNRAFSCSSGEVIVLLAGDDTLPPDSLSARVSLLQDVVAESAMGFFKLRTFSDLKKFDGMVLPRGGSGSRSGGAFAMTRTLAQQVFPLDETLVSEDLWCSFVGTDLADSIRDSDVVVLNYRIHPGNSFAHQRSYEEMRRSLIARDRVWGLLLARKDLRLSEAAVARLELLARVAEHYSQGHLIKILRESGLPLRDRLAMASTCSPSLYRVRSALYRQLSGRRRA